MANEEKHLTYKIMDPSSLYNTYGFRIFTLWWIT